MLVSLGKKRQENGMASKIGNENSARSFSGRSFLSPPSGRGRPRLRVMDVRTDMLVFPGFPGPDRSFCPRTSAGISAWTSAGYPTPKLTLWAAFSFLTKTTAIAKYYGFGAVVFLVRKGPLGNSQDLVFPVGAPF